MQSKSLQVTYYFAICVFLVCLVTMVVKLTFWPACPGGTTCDGWTIAGVVAAIMGVAASFLGILGAIMLAAWWTGLDKRVEERVATAFSTQVQAVQDRLRTTLDDFVQLQTKVDALLASAKELGEDLQTKTDAIQNLEMFAQEVRDKANEAQKKQAAITANLKNVTDAMVALNPQTAVVLMQHELEENVES